MNFTLPKKNKERKRKGEAKSERGYSNCNCNEIMENGSLMDEIEMFSSSLPAFNPLSASSSASPEDARNIERNI